MNTTHIILISIIIIGIACIPVRKTRKKKIVKDKVLDFLLSLDDDQRIN